MMLVQQHWMQQLYRGEQVHQVHQHQHHLVTQHLLNQHTVENPQEVIAIQGVAPIDQRHKTDCHQTQAETPSEQIHVKPEPQHENFIGQSSQVVLLVEMLAEHVPNLYQFKQ